MLIFCNNFNCYKFAISGSAEFRNWSEFGKMMDKSLVTFLGLFSLLSFNASFTAEYCRTQLLIVPTLCTL